MVKVIIKILILYLKLQNYQNIFSTVNKH